MFNLKERLQQLQHLFVLGIVFRGAGHSGSRKFDEFAQSSNWDAPSAWLAFLTRSSRLGPGGSLSASFRVLVAQRASRS
jgi:hypothetical protein